ncbi:META domain-containing protein [Photobacterium damselae subsp. damselae]|uniref:META domain-containing protein n=1 Tax=Photobacterium damselae TaxID=38293 RepID=UPI00311B31BC
MTFKMKKIALASSVALSSLFLQACNDAKAPEQPTSVEQPAAVSQAVDTTAKAQAMKTLDVNVIYLDRRMLPPGAELTVVLEDVSKADAPAEVIATESMEPAGAPPYAVALKYDANKLAEKHRYNVRATIKMKDQLIMTSTEALDPFAADVKQPVEVKLTRVTPAHNSAEKAAEQKANASFTNTYWKLMTLDGKEAQLGAGDKELFVQFNDDGLKGFSGCNSFMGTYQAKEGKLTLGPVAATQKMCVKGMEQEGTYLKAINEMASYSVTGETLTVKNNKGQVVATFESRYMN